MPILSDILTFNETLLKKLQNKKAKYPSQLYDVHKTLMHLIQKANTFAVHYLLYKEVPLQKWLFWNNKNLESLNNATKAHLLALYHLAYENNGFLVDVYGYNPKYLSSFINFDYTIGKIDDSLTLWGSILSTNPHQLQHKFSINLKEHQARVQLHDHILKQNETLKKILESLQSHICKNYTICDLFEE